MINYYIKLILCNIKNWNYHNFILQDLCSHKIDVVWRFYVVLRPKMFFLNLCKKKGSGSERVKSYLCVWFIDVLMLMCIPPIVTHGAISYLQATGSSFPVQGYGCICLIIICPGTSLPTLTVRWREEERSIKRRERCDNITASHTYGEWAQPGGISPYLYQST